MGTQDLGIPFLICKIVTIITVCYLVIVQLSKVPALGLYLLGVCKNIDSLRGANSKGAVKQQSPAGCAAWLGIHTGFCI